MSNYVFPVQNYNAPVQQHWGSVNGGSDLMSPRGSNVLNMQAGKVIESGWDRVGGWSVLVQGEDGNQYYYAHFDSASPVKVGQVIPEGTYLGPVGNTGDAAGGPTHLHIGIGPKILLGNDKYGGTGGDFDAVSLLKKTMGGGAAASTGNVSTPKSASALDYADKAALQDYIRQAATARNIDPETALAVANSEGFNNYVGDNNSSFGPFQLHYGGVAAGGNSVTGMGDAFTRQTGLDARNPNTVTSQIDYALDQAATNGWGAWHGAQRLGLGNFAGIGPNAKALGQGSPAGANVGPTRPANIPDWVPQSMWNMYNSNLYSGAKTPSTLPIPSLGNTTPSFSGFSGNNFETLPFSGPPPNWQAAMNQWNTAERQATNPMQDPWTNMTPLSDPTQFSPYNAPIAQPNLMSRMSNPGSLYG